MNNFNKIRNNNEDPKDGLPQVEYNFFPRPKQAQQEKEYTFDFLPPKTDLTASTKKKRTEYADFYKTGIKTIDDFKKLDTKGQLKYVSDILEAGDSDMGYATFEAIDILNNVADDGDLPPLIRVLAKGYTQLDPNSPNYVDPPEPDWIGDEKLRRTYGYSTIAQPLDSGTLTKEEEEMDEPQILDAIRQLEIDEKKLPREAETGSPEDDMLWEHYSRRNELDYALERLCFLRNQERLHKEFPSLPKEKQLIKIASDAAATVDFQEKYDLDYSAFAFSPSFGLISDLNGHVMPASELGTSLNTDKNISTYLEILHKNDILEPYIGVDLEDITLKSQVQLLKFMAEASNDRFDNLCSKLDKLDDKRLKKKLLESFVAADFGEDFGDALLDIAGSERFTGEQVGEILDTIESCRNSIAEVCGLFGKLDEKFAKDYARAANERLTDAITVFRQIAVDGHASAELEWFGEANLDYDSAMEALKYESKSLEIISGTLNDVESKVKGSFAERVLKPDEVRGRSLYSFYSPQHGYVLLYTRPGGSHTFDPMLEYGKVRNRYDINAANGGVEASISLITNPVDPFALSNPFRPDRHKIKNPNYYDAATMDKVSAIRLDREGRAPGAPADDPNRDPINPIGTISVDLAAINDRADTPSGKIARLFSVGGKLREQANGVEYALNHNTKWFEQDTYGTASGFKKLAEYVDGLANKWCADLPPKPNEGFRGAMRNANHKRGGMVAKANQVAA